MISPRAAHDFTTIRARLDELRRERADASPERMDEPSVSSSMPYHRKGSPEGSRPSHPIRQKLLG